MAGTYSSEILDQPDGIASPFFQSTLMHGLIVGALIGYGYLHNMFHGSEWGANNFQQGAIQATLVSTAALPLPQDHPPTDNVLATEAPSVAPALEEQKQEPIPLPDALPIPEKKAPPPKPEPKPLPKAPPQHEPPPKPQNKANYGEAAPANVPRATAANNAANSPIAQTGGDFGSRFGWYVDVIKRKVAQDWYLQEVEPSTPAGATVFVQFTVARDGSPGSITLATPSSFPSLK